MAAHRPVAQKDWWWWRAFIQNHKWNTIEKWNSCRLSLGENDSGLQASAAGSSAFFSSLTGRMSVIQYWNSDTTAAVSPKGVKTERETVKWSLATQRNILCAPKKLDFIFSESSQKKNHTHKQKGISQLSVTGGRRSAEIYFKAAPALNWLPPAGGGGVTEREASVDSVESKLGQCGSKLMCGARSHKDRSSNTTP